MEDVEFANNKKPFVFRYRQNNDFTLSEIENSYVYFPNNEKLNDPFDANHSLINIPKDSKAIIKLSKQLSDLIDNETARKYFEKFYKENPNKLYEFIASNIKIFFSKFGIACFTISPANLMLWATYANNHQGICIQYNTDLDKDLFDDIRLVEYVNKFQRIDYLPESEHDSLLNLFFKKLEVWRYEYELRVIKEESGIHKMNPLAIRSIAFGLRSSAEFKGKVVEIIKSKHTHIKLYETSILEDNYGLSFTEMIFD